ncbi:MAG: hypothetical protein B7Y99_13305 [Caulobacterales bacterium 32-69-10]|nr:MAG: hypothetical protein B7Y99_13305 [Caulobacterales bacterium 32-69-10]
MRPPMRPAVRFAFAALTAAAVAGPGLLAPARAAEVVSVPIDQAVRVDVGGLISSVVIANPGVADVRVVDSHTFYLMGNGYGTTNVVALDRDGRNVYSSEVVVTAGNAGRVSVFRGSARTDMACAASCQPAMRSGAGGGPSGGGGGGAAPSGGGVAGALGSALGGGGTP